MKQSRVLTLAIAVVLAAAVITPAISAGDGPSAGASSPSASASAAKPLGAQLAGAVLNHRKIAAAVKATRRVLALSGVATVKEGQTIVPGVAPLSRWTITARETVLLAMSADNPTVKLSQLAGKFSAAGVEMGDSPAKTALPEMVRRWISFANGHKTQLLSAPALFVRELESRRPSRTPLRTRMFYPGRIELSPLAALVTLANLERVIEPAAPRRGAQATASAGGPCASVQAALDEMGPVASGAASVVIGEATGSAVGAYADSLKNGAGDKVGSALTALDVADRLMRTMAFAQHVEVRVFPQENDKIHKPRDDKQLQHFVAIVGLSDEARNDLKKQLDLAKDQAFQESLINCAKLHGITIPRPYSDLAEEMTDWSAFWTLHSSPSDVTWGHPRRTDLQRLDFSEAVSRFKVYVQTENRKWHTDPYSLLVTSDAVAEVEIAAQKPPSPVSIVKLSKAIATGGTPEDYVGPIAELLEGMYRTAAKPTGSAALTVQEHLPNPCALRGGSSHRC